MHTPSSGNAAIPNVLTIAGSDPSGGAGIQADLKTFCALGAFGTTVITALTAQNTQGVSAVHAIPAAFVAAQIDTLFDDVTIHAAKLGMLADAEIIHAVAGCLGRRRPSFLVLDPVMVSKSGHRLLAEDAVAALRDTLLPMVDLITPNLPEAADLLGESEAVDRDAMLSQARRLAALGPAAVLLKGGHLGGTDSPDLLLSDGQVHWLESPRVATRNSHGTGCTLSAAIAALRPQRSAWLAAVREAKGYLTEALRSSDRLRVGSGQGPVHHFHRWF